jgi:hypothetical protein
VNLQVAAHLWYFSCISEVFEMCEVYYISLFLFKGDDRSESSESTSGCSSLVPQANRQFHAAGRVMNSLSGRRRSMDEKLNFSKLCWNKALHIFETE